MRVRLALLLVGSWIGTSAAMWVVASTNFATVDRVLEPGYRPELAERLAPRTVAEERPVLRFLAAELNRRFFRWWGTAQLALAVALLALVGTGAGSGARVLAALVAVASAVL